MKKTNSMNHLAVLVVMLLSTMVAESTAVDAMPATAGAAAKIKEHNPAKLRGSVAEIHGAVLGASQHRKPIIVALQAKSSKKLQSSLTNAAKAHQRAHKRAGRTMAKAKGAHVLHKAHLHTLRTEKVDLCNGNQFAWMEQIKQQCKSSYGGESIWDSSKAEGACQTAWDECNSDFASSCCTQPEGAVSMAAYCSQPNSTQDRACAVQGSMASVATTMTNVRDIVGGLNTAPAPAPQPTVFQVVSGSCSTTDAGRCIVSPNWPEDYADDEACEIKAPSRGVTQPRIRLVAQQFETESCCDKLIVGRDVFSGDISEWGPNEEITEGPTITWETDFSASSKGWKVCVEDIVPGPAPYPSPYAYHGPAPAPAPARPRVEGPRKPTMLEMQCARLTELVRRAVAEMDGIREFAAHDGIAAGDNGDADPQSPTTEGKSLLATYSRITKAKVSTSTGATSEESDPDLTFALRRVLTVGQQLDNVGSSFCASPTPAEDDDDDDDDDDEDDMSNATNATGALVSSDPALANETDETERSVEDEQPKVNGAALLSLMAFDDEMKGAVDNFETSVHPHGKKWWRYRYEYTLVESLVLAFAVLFLYFVMYLLHGVSFFGKFKFYNTGKPDRLLRYAWGYFVFHAAALMVMVTFCYMLYMPWGESNVFDIGAKALHEFVDGRANVPILGHSWLIMTLDVMFQLFVCFSFYGLFIIFVIGNFQKALDDWKALSDDDENFRQAPINVELYRAFNQILTHRVQGSQTHRETFRQMKLRLANVDGLSVYEDGWMDFSLHLYFTESLGRALEYLVEVSLKSNGFLAISALFVGYLAHHFQVAFMYFLPIFVSIALLLFVVGFFVGRSIRNTSHNNDHHKPHWITVHSYCRAVQIALYCVFFSFSRLLLSNDIFTDYPKVYLASVIGILVILFAAWFVAGEMIKETVCAIVLPPQIDEATFKKNLQQVVYWHTTENCQECGVRQFPRGASLSREYAGVGKGGADKDLSASDTARRPFSWRG